MKVRWVVGECRLLCFGCEARYQGPSDPMTLIYDCYPLLFMIVTHISQNSHVRRLILTSFTAWFKRDVRRNNNSSTTFWGHPMLTHTHAVFFLAYV